MKKYKLIINFNADNEKVYYFDRLTTKKLRLILDNPQYMYFAYYEYMECYILIQDNLSSENKQHFNNNYKFYCEKHY